MLPTSLLSTFVSFSVGTILPCLAIPLNNLGVLKTEALAVEPAAKTLAQLKSLLDTLGTVPRLTGSPSTPSLLSSFLHSLVGGSGPADHSPSVSKNLTLAAVLLVSVPGPAMEIPGATEALAGWLENILFSRARNSKSSKTSRGTSSTAINSTSSTGSNAANNGVPLMAVGLQCLRTLLSLYGRPGKAAIARSMTQRLVPRLVTRLPDLVADGLGPDAIKTLNALQSFAPNSKRQARNCCL